MIAVSATALLVCVIVLYGTVWLAVLLGAFALITPLIAAIDLRWRVVPNRIVLPAAAVALALAAATGLADGDPGRVLSALAGSAAMFAVYLLPAIVAPKAMGMGDVKLGLLVGAVLGTIVWPGWLTGVLAGFIVGALLGLLGLITRRLSLGSQLPYAPAMLAGAWASIIVLGLVR